MINANHLAHATRIIQHHKQRGAVLFGSGREVQRLVVGIDRIRDTLASAGELGISQTDMLFKTRRVMAVRELEYLLQLMHEIGMVHRLADAVFVQIERVRTILHIHDGIAS